MNKRRAANRFTAPSKSRSDHVLAINRGHLRIENRVFDIRIDVFGEDRGRMHCGFGLDVLAAIRNGVLNVFRLSGSQNNSASLRKCT